jgi:sortase A
VYVDADLTSRAQPSPGGHLVISTDETALSGDDAALAVIALLAIALALLSVAGTVAAIRWSPWLAYLSVAPIALAVLWILYQNLATVLPNVY